MNSERMSSLIALRLSGRLRVIVAIAASTFRSIRVKFMVVSLELASEGQSDLMLFSLTIFFQRASSAWT